ncbi:polysaccharide deacetylase family protein [Sulfurihydrogenibium subterraneum]|uniref:polysaccharide deacetylase family protein n=1 Tax=Sulfurihydrogenibium subterraneum TaxID=171121 RepID=UPI00048AF551|nr:polysaccharide deacetylase family protein [Sulfurihydrogenibium subterraneum]
MLYKLNVSIHDITKSNLEMIEELLEFLNNLGVENLTFLLIPFYHEKGSLFEIKQWLYENIKDNEVVLHGYTHKSGKFYSYKDLLTNQEGEFAYYQDTEERIKKGLEMLKSLGYNPEGFIPPAWLMKKSDFQLLKKYGFKFTTDRRFVYDLENNKKILSPVLSFGSRGFIETLSVISFKRHFSILKLLNPVVIRIALHPVDVLNKKKLKLVKDILDSHDFEFIFLKDTLNFIKN